MEFWSETNWFAIQARPHQEYLGATNVAKLDIEVFLPRVHQTQAICGVPRRLIKPLFPGYFFSRFVPIVSMEAVRFCRGVLRVVGTSRFPIPLETEIIANLLERVRPDGLIHLEPRMYKPGDRVRIEQGPFEGFIGR